MKKIILFSTFLILLSVAFIIFIKKKTSNEVVYYGRIQTYLDVYNNASVNLYDAYQLNLSDMYFRNDVIVEYIPENEYATSKPYNLIYQNSYIDADSLGALSFEKPMKQLQEKKNGAVFIYDTIRNYARRVNMTDTVLNERNLKRFYIQSEHDFSVFYIDTELRNLPYSFNFVVDRDYNGALTRIDTYQSEMDKFTTLRLLFTDTIPQIMYDALNRLQPK